MQNSDLILQTARRTLAIERDTLERLTDSIDATFVSVVERIAGSEGRVIVTGIGKTALVAKKIVATLNSTGTPALFLHAADAIHGDIGMVQANDIVLCLSKSGETSEVTALTLPLRARHNPIVAVVTNPDSTLARRADYVLHTPVDREADPNDLAPTASTTAQMALGDALAMSLLALRGFSAEDFARFHPGGTLGKQLTLTIADLRPELHRPVVYPDTLLTDTLIEMSRHRIGATAVLERESEKIIGIITDGDLRRFLEQHEQYRGVTADRLMSPDPRRLRQDRMAVEAMSVLRKYSIQQLLVTDEWGRYVGFLHLHELLREGLA